MSRTTTVSWKRSARPKAKKQVYGANRADNLWQLGIWPVLLSAFLWYEHRVSYMYVWKRPDVAMPALAGYALVYTAISIGIYSLFLYTLYFAVMYLLASRRAKTGHQIIKSWHGYVAGPASVVAAFALAAAGVTFPLDILLPLLGLR